MFAFYQEWDVLNKFLGCNDESTRKKLLMNDGMEYNGTEIASNEV
jgi:hypothetical protein